MEGRCLPCSSPFNGEEEEGEGEEKFSSRALRVRTAAPPGLDLPRRNRGGDGHRGRLANGTHKQATQDGVLEVSSRYTSLRDLLPPPALQSPTAAAAGPHGREIAIRNRLVKQAACAYLQPAGASSPRSSRGRGCLRWLRWEVEGCIGFVAARVLPGVRRAFGCLLARFRGRTVRESLLLLHHHDLNLCASMFAGGVDCSWFFFLSVWIGNGGCRGTRTMAALTAAVVVSGRGPRCMIG
ncbi:hypothetical protein Taro_040951 [Colocasia esculenta]|uniref:Uncharacterized protein n=1 Tax=Colocasia esculenta TaxID=4460 RepID=A0A843WW00_COLES|nr:hypothetical protein [Colocasia esculenta]